MHVCQMIRETLQLRLPVWVPNADSYTSPRSKIDVFFLNVIHFMAICASYPMDYEIAWQSTCPYKTASGHSAAHFNHTGMPRQRTSAAAASTGSSSSSQDSTPARPGGSEDREAPPPKKYVRPKPEKRLQYESSPWHSTLDKNLSECEFGDLANGHIRYKILFGSPDEYLP